MKTNHNHAVAATENACKLCAPLGAALVFKGIKGAIPLLHGSQGCSTYIRRYLISHFKEPVDIACTNFAEETAIFGGGANLQIALDNIRQQYTPSLVGIATTCLSETIGDDVPMFIREYISARKDETLPPLVHVATPSYQGTHMEGFHNAVSATVVALAEKRTGTSSHVNLFPGMVSPADLRYLKEIMADFGLPVTLLPDYSSTLDGPLWTEYHRLPAGGTAVEALQKMGNAAATIAFGRHPSPDVAGPAEELLTKFGIPAHELGMPIGVKETDRFFKALQTITGLPVPEKHAAERGRLLDSYVDGHKYVMEKRAVVYGEVDLVVGVVSFLNEIGVVPVLCATGGKSRRLKTEIASIIPDYETKGIQIMDDADFVEIETVAETSDADFFIGNSKGYTAARRLGLPMIRIGFPIHDRIGGARRLHLGYRGTQQLFDEVANTLLGQQQSESTVGYTYM